MTRAFIILLALSFLLIETANYFIFNVVPTEATMGPVQRIFYFHVASAIACYFAFGAVAIASLYYLATRSVTADTISAAAGEVGFLFCTITLITGMIWGHSAWNTWFSWQEPRLVTFLVLWLIFLSFSILRNIGDPTKIRAHSAVIGILGALSIPLVWFSIKLLPQTARLHPEVIENNGLRDWSYRFTFILSVFALTLFMSFLIYLRARIFKLENDALTLKRN